MGQSAGQERPGRMLGAKKRLRQAVFSGLTPRLRHGELAHLAQGGVAGGEETCGKVSKGLSADGRGPTDAVRLHRGTREGTRHQRAEMKVTVKVPSFTPCGSPMAESNSRQVRSGPTERKVR